MDLNRAGVPRRSSRGLGLELEEAVDYLTELKAVLKAATSPTARCRRSLRCDANISGELRREGWGAKVEVRT